MANPGLLHGITILDLTDEATAFGTRLLAELGARVIRVEDQAGDGVRRKAPFLHGRESLETSYSHLVYNAGKESVALDFASAEAWSAVERMAELCDAVVGPLNEPQQVKRFLDGLATEPWAPGIVRTVFRRGSDDVADDLVATAAGGLLVVNGFPDDPPNHPAGNLAYKETSLAAAQAAIALIFERKRTGAAPGSITVSMQEAVNFTTLQTSNANWWHWQGRVPSRKTPLSPFTTHKSRDGLWLSFTIHPPNWPRYLEWIRTELQTDELDAPEWADGAYRAQNIARMAALTAELCSRHTREELIDAGQSRGLLVLPVNTIEDIANDRHLSERGFFADLEHAELGESLRLPRSAFISDGSALPLAAAPALGQHTEAVLRDVGCLTWGEVDRLFAVGAATGPRASKAAEALPDGRATDSERSHAAARVADAGGAEELPNRTEPRHPERLQPLKGIRVLDFCWAIAGPLGTRLLADMGADVIKVESEYRLDPIRQIGVQPQGQPPSWNTNGQFNDCNTAKRALTLNLNTPEGIEIVRRLVATADVVTSNYTPDRLDKWGLGYEDLRAIKPDIIVANMAVMGVSGPHKDWRSYGSGIVAMCGLASLTGFEGREPIGLGTLHTDFTVPYFGAMHVMAALLHRDRTGEGTYLELAQYESSVHLLDTELAEYLNDGTEPVRRGNRSRTAAPHGVFPAAGEDRWIAIACRNDAEWERLNDAAGLGFAARYDRFANVEAVERALSAWTGERDAWETAATLQRAGVPASPVEDLHDLLHRDKAMMADYYEVPLPSGVTAIVQHQPILWDGERLPIVRAPLWGEHTDEILRGELGLGDEEIATLAERNVLY